MQFGIQLYLAGLSLSNTIATIDIFGVECCRFTVHNWAQKADLQPAGGADPNRVAVDETVIQLNNDQLWLYAAVDSATNRLLHVKLFPTRNQAIAEIFLINSARKISLMMRYFLSILHHGYKQCFIDTASITDTRNMVIVTASNVSSEN